ncbi:MAG: hypothetical protein QXL94_00235 [Candidatus Parvarchaeum sp.]
MIMCNDGRIKIENCEYKCQHASEYTLKNGFLYEECPICGHYTMYHRENENWINGIEMKEEAKYQGIANDPLESVNVILRQLKYHDRGEIEFFDENGESVDEETSLSYIHFSVNLWENDTYKYLTGITERISQEQDLDPIWRASANLEIIFL